MITEEKTVMSTQLLRNAIERAIMTYDPIRTSETAIDIVVKDGEVMLEGYVRTDSMRTIASQLAQRVKGVRTVRNNLLSDSNLEIEASQALEMELGTYILPMMPVVRVLRGHLFLRGPVPSENARELVEETAQHIPGTIMVHNLLEVDPEKIERLVAPKKIARAGGDEGAGGQQAMVGGKPVTEEDLPDWALKPKEAWGMPEYKARAKAKMTFKRGEGPDPKEMEEAGAILRTAGAESEAPAEAEPEPVESAEEALQEPLEDGEMATNPAPEVEEEDVPEAEVDLEALKAQFPAWALKPKDEWDKDDFKGQMQAKRAAKAGEGDPPEVIIEKAQAALKAAQSGGKKKESKAPKDSKEAVLEALRQQYPGWALSPRKEWRPEDFAEAADARVAEIRGQGKPVTELRAEAQEALEAAMRGEAVSGPAAAQRRDLTPEEVAEVRGSLADQYPGWALKPKDEWDKDDFKGQMRAKRAAKAGEGEPPEEIIEQAQKALEKALKEAWEALPLEGGEEETAAEPASNGKKEIPPELFEQYPGWALKPKDEWDKDDFKAHAKAKSAFKKGEGPDPEAILAEAQDALG